MSKSSQRRISRRKPKTKVSLGTIAEFQRRLDSIQLNLAKVWGEGFDEGLSWGAAEESGNAIGDPVNPYLEAMKAKPADPIPETITLPNGSTVLLDSYVGQIQAESEK